MSDLLSGEERKKQERKKESVERKKERKSRKKERVERKNVKKKERYHTCILEIIEEEKENEELIFIIWFR